MSDTPPPPGEDSPASESTGGPDPSETVSLPTTQPQPTYEPPADAGVAPPPAAPPPAAPEPAAPYAPPAADPYGAPPPADPGYVAAGSAAATPGYPPGGGYAPPPPGPPPTQAGWGAGGGTVPPAYGAPPPSGGGGKKALMIVLIVVGVLFLGLVALALIGLLAGDDDDAPTVDRTTITTPTTAPTFDPDTTEGPSPGDSALDPTTTQGGGTSIDVFDLEVGDCFDVPSTGNISDVEGLDCDEPHDNEVFAIFEIAGGPNAPFPGSEAVSREAQAECTGTLFSDYVGVPFQQSSFSATSINPTRETWERLDDREVICVITGGDGGTLTSSAQGANR